MRLNELTAHQLAKLLARGEVSAVEIVEDVIARMEAVEGRVRAFLTRTPEQALEQARASDERRRRGAARGPLDGLPIVHKDVLCTQGLRTTCGSRILENFVPPYDATVVARGRAAGLITLGKCNMDEFAMGSSTENSAFFPTHNPWNLETVPGGSSGGSAAAVAAHETILATGSDTGGSIRQPAAFCGVVGLKPTYGRVSRYGLVAFASSLDQVGPITKDVTDAALLMNVIAGHDPRDSTSANLPVPDYTRCLTGSVQGLRIGVVSELMGPGIAPEVREAVQAALGQFEALGARCEEVSLPHSEYGLATYYIIAPAEASSNLARYDGVQYGYRTAASLSSQGSEDEAPVVQMYSRTRAEGFGSEVKHRIMLGTYALSAGYYDAYYLKALRVRTLIKRDFEKAFESFDVLITPTAPTVAFKIGEKASDPLQMKLADICTIPINLAGICALSLPCGFSQGLPIGLQIIGKAFDEGTVLRAAQAYEQATPWHTCWPTL